MNNMISPNYSDKKFHNPSVDDLIDVFEDRIRFWVLEPAKSLLTVEHGQIAAICLALTYFEGMWSYVEGRGSQGKSKQFFEKGFVDVFRGCNLNEKMLCRIADILYRDTRCGFFHGGMFRERVFFVSLLQGEMLVTLPKKGGQIDDEGTIQSLQIDVGRFLSAVESHFGRYISTLRDAASVERRNKFFLVFKEQCNWEAPDPAIGIANPSDIAT